MAASCRVGSTSSSSGSSKGASSAAPRGSTSSRGSSNGASSAEPPPPAPGSVQRCGSIHRRGSQGTDGAAAAALAALAAPPPAIPRGIIDPNNQRKREWDGLMAFLIIYSILVVPLRLGFGLCVPLFSDEFWVDLVVDCCFITDITLCFRTAVLSINDEDEEHLVVDGGDIASGYLRGWFVIDLASSVPIDTIIQLFYHFTVSDDDDGAAGPSAPPPPATLSEQLYPENDACGGAAFLRTLKLIRLVRLLKLFRFLKLGRLIKKLEDQLDVNPAVIRFTSLLIKIIFLSHLIACAWMTMHSFRIEKVAEDGFALTWIEAYAQYYEDGLGSAHGAHNVRNDLTTQYLSAMYWGFTTLTTVGYGDIVPVNNDERLFVVVMEFVGLTVFGMVIGTITQIASNFNMQKKLQRERTDQVNRYMRERGLGKALQRRIRAFYEYYLERKSVFDVAQMLDEVRIPSHPFRMPFAIPLDSACPSLRGRARSLAEPRAYRRTSHARAAPQVSTTIKNELCAVMFKELMRDIPFFRERDASLVALICIKLEPFFVLAGEYICRKGVIGMEMYWVRKGRVSLIDPKEQRNPPSPPRLSGAAAAAAAAHEDVVGELQNGEAFGQEALLFNQRQKWDVRAITYCDMIYLSRECAAPPRRPNCPCPDQCPDQTRETERRHARLLDERAAHTHTHARTHTRTYAAAASSPRLPTR